MKEHDVRIIDLRGLDDRPEHAWQRFVAHCVHPGCTWSSASMSSRRDAAGAANVHRLHKQVEAL